MMKLSNSGIAAVLLTVVATAPALAAGDAAKGKTVFSRCSGCHAVTEQNKVGPHLSGVVGRTAGAVAGARYSKAMAASGIVWDEQTLDKFLADPAKALPGTTMAIKLPNPQDRADVIAFLETLTKP